MELNFSSFWAIYPRKVSKLMAQKAWNKLTPDEQAQALEALPVHIAYWKATDTEPQYIPHCSTWLNQQRFTDELEMPVPKAEKPAVAWWSNEQLILAKGREMGLLPRPGEDIWSYKARLSANLKAA